MRLLEQSSFALEEGPGSERVSTLRWLDKGAYWTYTERFLSSLMALISIFLRPMVTKRLDSYGHASGSRRRIYSRWRQSLLDGPLLEIKGGNVGWRVEYLAFQDNFQR